MLLQRQVITSPARVKALYKLGEVLTLRAELWQLCDERVQLVLDCTEIGVDLTRALSRPYECLVVAERKRLDLFVNLFLFVLQ